MTPTRVFTPVLFALALLPGAARGQAAEHPLIEVGAAAPALELEGATRWGVLREPLRLEDFRGKTVVLAFFFRARTPG